nr:unnamed protein product [Callosobruchus chinensis]
MTFTRKIDPICFLCEIGNRSLQRVGEFKDLGVLFDSKLSFADHIKTIITKRFKHCGFVIRNTRQFDVRFVVLCLCSIHP